MILFPLELNYHINVTIGGGVSAKQSQKFCIGYSSTIIKARKANPQLLDQCRSP